MQQDHSVHAGDRIGYVDGDVIHLGTVLRSYGGGEAVTVTWDDGHVDTGAEALYSPHDLKRLA